MKALGAMTRGRLVAAVLSSVGAVAACHGPPHQISDASRDVATLEARADLAPDAAACGCRVDDNDVLLLSWECYCQLPFVGCAVPLSVPADCALRERTDYADCGLTVITQDTGASAGLPTVYDANGRLVGRLSHSEVSGYACPSDPAVFGSSIRAGLFAGPACHGVSCGGCYDGAFPCEP